MSVRRTNFRGRMVQKNVPKKLFYIAAGCYGLWFVWLLYVAMVNVQAGNP